MKKISIKKINIDKLNTKLFLVLLFILPIFFLRCTNDKFDYGKQFLLFLLVPAMFFICIIYKMHRGKIKMIKTPLDRFVLSFVFFLLISAWLSMDSFVSFWGDFNNASHSVLGTISLVALFYYILSHYSNKGRAEYFTIIKTLVYSLTLFLIVNFLARIFVFFGLITLNTLHTYGNLAGGNYFNVGLVSLFLFLLLFPIVFLTRVSFLSNFENSFFRFSFILSVWSFFALINAGFVVLLFVFGLFIWLLYHLFGRLIGRLDKKFFTTFVILLVIFSALVYSYDLFSPFTEPVLPIGEALNVAKQALLENPVFGSGPGTYQVIFSRFKDASFVSNTFGSFRFYYGHSYFLDLFSTAGTLVAMSYLFLVATYMLLLARFFYYTKNKLDKLSESDVIDLFLITTSLSISSLFILFASFLFPLNTIMLFLMWLSMALSLSAWRKLLKLISDNTNSIFSSLVVKRGEKMFLTISTIVYLVLFLWLSLAFLSVKYLVAEAMFKSGGEVSIVRAVRLNPNRYHYNIELAKYYHNQTLVNLSNYPNDFSSLSNSSQNSIKFANDAVQTQPDSVITNEILGMIYRDISPYSLGSENWARRSFETALENEPTNYILLTEVAKLNLKLGNHELALNGFNMALAIKSDYYDARLGLATALSGLGKTDKAIELLEVLANENINPDLYYELGRIYHNDKNDLDVAIKYFSKALSVFSGHSNSLYGLAVIMETRGDTGVAIDYYERALLLNPGSVELINKINNLK